MNFKDKMKKKKAKEKSIPKADSSEALKNIVDIESVKSTEIVAGKDLYGQDKAEKLVELHWEYFEPDPEQPRKEFSDSYIEELRSSIESIGQLQPIVVWEADGNGKHRIIGGECRWRAIRGSDKVMTVKALVKSPEVALNSQIQNLGLGDDEQRSLLTRIMQLSENEQDQTLNALELTKAYTSIYNQCGKDLQLTAELVSKTKGYVSNILKLGELSKPVAALIEEGKTKNVDLVLSIQRLYESDSEAGLYYVEHFDEILKDAGSNLKFRDRVREERKKSSSKKPDTKTSPGSSKGRQHLVDDFQFDKKRGVLKLRVGNKEVFYALSNDLRARLIKELS